MEEHLALWGLTHLSAKEMEGREERMSSLT